MNNTYIALLLEDEPLIAIDVEQTLQDQGFDVTTVLSSSEALDWLAVCRPHIAIVDIFLRDGPCESVVRQLVDDGVPFIVHSGQAAGRHRDTAFVQGVWVNKPSPPGKLAEVARSIVVR